jgi:hypothetical protein
MTSRDTDFRAAAGRTETGCGATGRVHECLIAIYGDVVRKDFNYVLI